MDIRHCGLFVMLIGVVCASSISLRTGMQAADNEPYQVFFACAGASFDFGSGITITRRHILTTASLIRGFVTWNVGYGSNSVTSLRYIESTVAFIHPSFNAVNSNNNLGVIVLPTALPSDSVRPIALPTANDGTFPRMNQEGRLVGFGIIDETKAANPSPNPFLKTIYLTVRNNDECLAANRLPNVDAFRNFCADDVHPGSTNVCHGDVGSGFVVTIRGQKILAGISSIVSEGCKSNEKATFVRIEAYLPWINAVTMVQ